MDAAEKTCASCGRRIEWRRRWADDWEQVRYCSAACRRRKVTAEDAALEAELLRMLQAGPRSATVDPDEVARAPHADDPASRAEPARRAARRLVAAGVAEMVQRGRIVDPSTARGPVQVRLAR